MDGGCDKPARALFELVFQGVDKGGNAVVNREVFTRKRFKADGFNCVEAEVAPRDPCDLIYLSRGEVLVEDVLDSSASFCAPKSKKMVTYERNEPAEKKGDTKRE